MISESLSSIVGMAGVIYAVNGLDFRDSQRSGFTGIGKNPEHTVEVLSFSIKIWILSIGRKQSIKC